MSTNEMKRIGVIGAGAIAQAAHIPGYAAADNCELIAIADPERGCLDMVAEKWGFTSVYSDWTEMLANERLDAVSICTPNALHAEMAITCLEYGCDLLLEKPIAISSREAEAISKAAEASGQRVMVSFTHRFNELNHAAKRELDDGTLGMPFMIRVRFAHTGPWPGWAKTDWFYRPELSGGGALLDMAIHAFDLCHWYIGPITAVQAKTATLRKDIAVDDNCVTILEFGGSCLGYVEAGWTSPSGFTGVEIMCDNGSLVVDYSANTVELTTGACSADHSINSRTEILANQTSASAWQNEMSYFTSQLATEESFSPDLEDGIAALNVALAASLSSQEGRRVEIPG